MNENIEIIKCKGCIRQIDLKSEEQFCQDCLPFKDQIEKILGNYPEIKSVSEISPVSGTFTIYHISKDQETKTAIYSNYYNEIGGFEVIFDIPIKFSKGESLQMVNNGNGVIQIHTIGLPVSDNRRFFLNSIVINISEE